MRITIGGRGLDFVLDTGASGITLDNGVARQLGLPAYGTHSAITAQRYTTARTIVPEMHVGQLTMKNVAVQLVPDGQTKTFGVKSVGLLGFDFLAELGVTVDYEHERVTACHRTGLRCAGRHARDPARRADRRRQPDGHRRDQRRAGERFMIDTGGAGSFMIFDTFARKHPEALHDEGGGDAFARSMTFEGVGGAITTKPYQIKSSDSGRSASTTSSVTASCRRAATKATTTASSGSTSSSCSTLGLDYANSRIYLVPNSFGRQAFGIRD